MYWTNWKSIKENVVCIILNKTSVSDDFVLFWVNKIISTMLVNIYENLIWFLF